MNREKEFVGALAVDTNAEFNREALRRAGTPATAPAIELGILPVPSQNETEARRK